MTRLLLIRHATNDALKEGLLVGRFPGVHLNDQGRDEALALTERLKEVELAAIYSSPMERARETAEPVAAAHGLEVHTHPGLHEVDCGRWTGQSLDRLHRRRLWRIRLNYPSGTRIPGGESAWDVQKRIVGALEEFADLHPHATVAVVSHADPIKAAVAHYIGLPLDLHHRLAIAPASLTVLSLDGPVPRLLCLGDASHVSCSEAGKGG